MKRKKILRPAPAASVAGATARAGGLPIAAGPFQPTMESLTSYSCPEWFRDAKFGIWAHWGPQAVPMEGDWYARKMYEHGSPAISRSPGPLWPPVRPAAGRTSSRCGKPRNGIRKN